MSTALPGGRAPVRRGIPRVSASGLLLRWLGIYLWSRARPETLPVPPLPGDERAAAPVTAATRFLGTINRTVAVLLVLAGLFLFFLSGIASRQVGRIDRLLLFSGPFLEASLRLESGFGDVWWSRFYPSYPGRFARLGAAMRQGREKLIEADRARVACAGLLNNLALPGRILRGPREVERFAREMSGVTAPFFRGTASFQAMWGQLAPYEKLGEKLPATVGGSLAQASPDHFLACSLLRADGTVLWPARPPLILEPGRAFELPLARGARLRLSDMVRSAGGTFEILEDLQMPLEELSVRGIVFPSSGGAFLLRFDQEDEDLAPLFDSLPAGAETELLPLPLELRGR